MIKIHRMRAETPPCNISHINAHFSVTDISLVCVSWLCCACFSFWKQISALNYVTLSSVMYFASEQSCSQSPRRFFRSMLKPAGCTSAARPLCWDSTQAFVWKMNAKVWNIQEVSPECKSVCVCGNIVETDVQERVLFITFMTAVQYVCHQLQLHLHHSRKTKSDHNTQGSTSIQRIKLNRYRA